MTGELLTLHDMLDASPVRRSYWLRLHPAVIALMKKAAAAKGVSVSHWLQHRIVDSLLFSEADWLERQFYVPMERMKRQEIEDHLRKGEDGFVVRYGRSTTTAYVEGPVILRHEVRYKARIAGQKKRALVPVDNFVCPLMEK